MRQILIFRSERVTDTIVPAHVEMMGFLGIGNNAMVGCTVACSNQRKSPVFASLRQPLLGAYRPLALLGSGVPAASMFCEHLADADDAALKRLVTVYILQKHPFKAVSFVCHLRGQKNSPFSGQNCYFTHLGQEKALFYGRFHKFHHCPQKCPFSWIECPSCDQLATCFRWIANGHSLHKIFGRQVYNMNS